MFAIRHQVVIPANTGIQWFCFQPPNITGSPLEPALDLIGGGDDACFFRP
jgi:hypothetical protein